MAAFCAICVAIARASAGGVTNVRAQQYSLEGVLIGKWHQEYGPRSAVRPRRQHASDRWESRYRLRRPCLRCFRWNPRRKPQRRSGPRSPNLFRRLERSATIYVRAKPCSQLRHAWPSRTVERPTNNGAEKRTATAGASWQRFRLLHRASPHVIRGV